MVEAGAIGYHNYDVFRLMQSGEITLRFALIGAAEQKNGNKYAYQIFESQLHTFKPIITLVRSF
jgi:hypothetical protein